MTTTIEPELKIKDFKGPSIQIGVRAAVTLESCLPFKKHLSNSRSNRTTWSR